MLFSNLGEIVGFGKSASATVDGMHTMYYDIIEI
jgi:hypothetical protein